jgi:PAT family beta-lactamase induction signal transducer AmpG
MKLTDFKIFMHYLSPKMLFIMLLGIASGLPLALSASTLNAYLFELGVNLKVIGFFAFTAMAYSLKWIWSPLIDNIKLPLLWRLGRRKSWLLTVQALLLIAIASLGLVDPRDGLAAYAGLVLCVTFLSATQDIIIDAFRIEILRDEEQGMGAANAIFGYRIGMLISTAGALYLADAMGWRVAFIGMAAIYVPCMFIELFIKETGTRASAGKTIQDWVQHAFIAPFKNFLTQENSLLIMLFIVFYKLSDAYLGVMTAPFLLDIGFTKAEMAKIVKLYGVVATLAGTYVGGYLIKRKNYRNGLLFGAVVQILSNLVFIWQNHMGHDLGALMVSISVENFFSGIGSAALIAYISIICNKEFTATQYALLSSLAVFGRTTISGSAGWVAQTIGWDAFFLVSAVVSSPVLVLIPIIFKVKR